MSAKIEETIKEIAGKHGIAVGRDDPVLILHTLNERLIQDSTEAQQNLLNAFKSELEEIAHRWGEDAKNKAERTLNAALTASKDAMQQGMQQGTVKVVEALQRESEGISVQLAAPIREAKRLAILNMIAAGIAVFAAGIALWAVL